MIINKKYKNKDNKKYKSKDFIYIDTGFMRSGIFTLIRLEKCSICEFKAGRGFLIKNKEVLYDDEKFVCMHCSFDFLNQNNIELFDKKQLSFFNTNIIGKYSDLRKRFQQGKISEANFILHLEEFSKFIYQKVIDQINYLVDLDIEYTHNKDEGSCWRGWWLNAKGNETSMYLIYLKDVINEKKYIKLRSPSMTEAYSLLTEFKQLLRVKDKFIK